MRCVVIFVVALLVVAVSSFEIVPFTAVANASQRRAVCMDGSPAGYHYSSGSGDGAQNWLVYLMGGGWCENIAACQGKLNQSYGSTRFGSPTANFTGILSNDTRINPDFYNWNRIYVVYCDQSSFLGDTQYDGPGPKVEFRGSRIFDAVVEDLMVQGLSVAENAILSGRSAGGLATILDCDDFRARLPNVGRVKCLSDAGFFIRAENVANADYREQYFASTIMLHDISSLLPATCTERIDPSLCLFPEYLVEDIQTPIFLLNSAFDYFQVEQRLVPPISPDWGRWDMCVQNMATCTTIDKQLIYDFGDAFFKAIEDIPYNPSRGMFIDACFIHSVAYDERYWSPNLRVKLGNLTVLEAFANWYFDRDCTVLEAFANWYFDRDCVTLVTSTDFIDMCT